MDVPSKKSPVAAVGAQLAAGTAQRTGSRKGANMPASVLTGSKIKNTESAAESTNGKARKIIKVNLGLQILEAYEGAERVFNFKCVTGDMNHATSRGKWKIFRKEEDYISRAYKVDMDYAMFFHKGQAIHQYHGIINFSLMRFTKKYVTELVGSAGCVRLREADAKALFFWAPYRTEVHVS